MYYAYNARPIPKPYRQSSPRRKILFVLFVILILLIYLAYAMIRPVAALKTTILPPVVPAQVNVNVPWPAVGQAAFGADGYGMLASHGDQTPRPTASVTKVVTAMAILDKKPLKPGESGPPLLMSERDVALYNQYVAMDGAVVPISVGQSITQYQALQAMLLPSANNIADSAALWAFGSMDAYTAHANQMVKKLGMTNTKITDASGFAPTTVSTASDLIKLGDAALDNPVLAEIVIQKEAKFPNYGTINNVNNLLGQVGIRGIKTGNTEEAGGCYLAAADIYIGNQKITVITAILGSTSRPQAMRDSVPIIQASVSEFQRVHVVRRDQTVGEVSAEWGPKSDIIANKDLYVVAWIGNALAPNAKIDNLQAPVDADKAVGAFELKYAGSTQTADLRMSDEIPGPTLWWRLTHPL